MRNEHQLNGDGVVAWLAVSSWQPTPQRHRQLESWKQHAHLGGGCWFFVLISCKTLRSSPLCGCHNLMKVSSFYPILRPQHTHVRPTKTCVAAIWWHCTDPSFVEQVAIINLESGLNGYLMITAPCHSRNSIIHSVYFLLPRTWTKERYFEIQSNYKHAVRHE